LRIFFVCQSTPNELQLPESRLWHANLHMSLVDLGHELVMFNHEWLSRGYYVNGSTAAGREVIARERPRFSEQLVERVKAEHQQRPIDLFFSYFSSSHVLPEAIRDIGALGIPTVNWYCNASYQFHLIEELAPAYHYCLVPEKFRLDDYRRVGANPIYCQEAANPRVYRPHDVPLQYDVTFVGQKYGTRPNFISRLVRERVPTRVWGPGWLGIGSSRWRTAVRTVRDAVLQNKNPPVRLPERVCGPPLDDESLVARYSRSKISLGFSAVAEIPADGSPPIKQVRLRDFEAPMSGAFYLIEQIDDLADYFVPDREIVFFADQDDLVDKARFYLREESLREKIRQAGLARARRDHTWQRRFTKVFAEMGLN
jgi:hypothetical protein